MATQYTSLLGLALPVTGELSGSWGDVVNTSITSLLDSAISGTTSLTTDADVTLTTTTGAANEARQAIILWNPASGTVTRNITAPAQSKIYTVINASGGTQSIVFRGAGPTTGVTIIKGESAVVAWNGTDFIKISNTGGGGSFTNVTISGTTTLSGLTASTALALNASKEVVSVTNTGTGNNVLATSPTLVTPALGTPSSVTLTNATGLPISTGVSGLGTGVATFLATPSSANLAAAVTDETGSGALVFATSPTLVTPALGTPSSVTLTNATGLPISTGVSGLGTGVAGALATNVGTAGSPVINGGVLGTPSSGTLTNATGLPISTGVSGLGTGVAGALATNVGSAGAPVLFNGALGTPSSGTVTNLTGTASININGTVGATTANTGAFTTLTTSSTVTLNGGTANGVAYLNGSKVLTSGSALTFDGSNLVVGTAETGLAGKVRVVNTVRVSDANPETNALLTTVSPTTATIETRYATPLLFGIGAAEQMRLTSTGLGIGTSSPGTKLQVLGTIAAQIGADGSNATGIRIYGSGSEKRVDFTGADGLANERISGIGTGGPGILTFSVNNNSAVMTERMRIDSSGNLGLGVTPSAWGSEWKAIEVSGSGDDNGAVFGGFYSTNIVKNAYHNGTNWIRRYTATEAPLLYTQSYSGQHQWQVGNGGTAGNAITFTQAATLTADGNFLVGKTSGVNKIETVGAGLDGNGTVNVGTTATTIYTVKQSGTGCMCVVYGDDGSAGFMDLLFFLANNTPQVITSKTIYGAPSARTYTSSSTALQCAMASGSLNFRTASLSTLGS